jgi:spermidine synthase/MFS family permease
MERRAWSLLFVFFAASGFASLVYEVVWLRMAMAQFGVTSALTSIVLSVFMAGLALGSWGAGQLARRLRWDEDPRRVLRAYGVLELLIGLSAFVVPALLRGGHALLAAQAETVSWRSPGYHLASGMWVVLAMLPFCALMGATFPTAMAALRRGAGAERSFSYLYLANVLGALAGTVASGFLLIELLGLRGTAHATAALNVAVGVTALLVASRAGKRDAVAPLVSSPPVALVGGRAALWFLFATGLMSLAMEVVWIRQFTPYLGTVVYAFAAVLALYLGGTFVGSRIYRSWIERRGGQAPGGALGLAWACVGVAALLPLVTSDPRLALPAGFSFGLLRVAAGILPFCATVGFLTPMLVDRWSQGDPRRAGDAYAINVLGCIAGPLLAGFVLLPSVSEAWALLVLGAPLAVSGALSGARGLRPALSRGLAVGVLALSLTAVACTRSYESRFPRRIVLRDEMATVVATGTGWNRLLLVNGFSMTILTPVSKVMAHLPLAFHPAPREGLVLCFGMGTTFRSMLRWGVPTTVVELVPSVPGLAGFYHDDGEALLHAPGAHVVIDDARRYLERTARQYDVITLDPPPPVEAAASSLLYSREFYQLVQRRLRPGGILQQWLPPSELELAVGFARTLTSVFPHVRMFGGIQGWGIHFLASDTPIPVLPAHVLARRLPPAAAADLAEWGPEPTAEAQMAKLLSHEISLREVLALLPDVPVLEDDRPYNEYFLIRRAVLRPQPGGVRFPTGLAGMPEPAPAP